MDLQVLYTLFFLVKKCLTVHDFFLPPSGLQRASAGSLPDHAGNLGAAELMRLQEEVLSSRSTLAAWEESMLQARKVGA